MSTPRAHARPRYRFCTAPSPMANSMTNMARKPEYCPISMGADIIAERWNLLILREMFAGACRFNDIHRGLPGLSRTLLSQRLRQLQRADLIEADANEGGYHFTDAGADLHPVLEVLGAWAIRWRFPRPSGDQLDPQLLMWRIRNGLDHDQVPDRRVVVQLDFVDERAQRGWLLLNGDDSSVCSRDPMFDVDLYASASSVVWHEIWYGYRSIHEAIAQQELRLSGESRFVTQFPGWLRLSPFADAVAEVTA